MAARKENSKTSIHRPIDAERLLSWAFDWYLQEQADSDYSDPIWVLKSAELLGRLDELDAARHSGKENFPISD